MKKRILVAPLNWGLGHVTRCIPLIHSALNTGCEVILASDGVAYYLLKAEFPNLPVLELPSYGMAYHSENMLFNIAPRFPSLYWAVKQEHRRTAEIVKQYNIDGILSDNRYGCWLENTPSVLLTHQLELRYPNKFLQKFTNLVLKRTIQSFHEIWVPDTPDKPNLSGELSHTDSPVHPNIRFVGILSRMEKLEVAKEYDVAIVLSGPEPQRSRLEEILMDQALESNRNFIIVQGKTQSKSQYRAAEHVEVVSYLTSAELNKVIMASDVVVCRSGYSSLMDLAKTGKPALLIPTPGQTEQEYLAEACAESGLFSMQKQSHVHLEKGILEAKNRNGFDAHFFEKESYQTVLRNWIEGRG